MKGGWQKRAYALPSQRSGKAVNYQFFLFLRHHAALFNMLYEASDDLSRKKSD